MSNESLYDRLDAYDGINTFVNNLLPRLQGDDLLGRFWNNRGIDGIEREKQLLIDFLCSGAGGPVYYTGRDMVATHKGMNIDESDWTRFFEHAGATMQALKIPDQECQDVVAFVTSLKGEIVE
ncbi:MAG: group 1 truncated hemoglobin [Pseudomonadales bacterium]|nr:group 1 truncated hemoglobin [Pseudomonadales bacterium]